MEEFLKEEVLCCLESTQMRDYVRKHFDELSNCHIIGILYYANLPLEKKAKLFEKLAEAYPCKLGDELDYLDDYAPYAEFLRIAVKNMEYREEERAAYLLRIYYEGMDEDMSAPFLTFETAIRFALSYMKRELKTDVIPPVKELDRHFEIEKWMPDPHEVMREVIDYLILPNGTVTGARPRNDRHGKVIEFDYSEGSQLNLPVPFHPGDIVTLDCRPYEPILHCVILSVGDNRDCCCVQCLYVDIETGKPEVGALKHSDFFCILTPYSPLYRAEIYEGDLPEEEQFMQELSTTIKSLGVRDDDCWIWMFLNALTESDVPAEEFAAKLREPVKCLSELEETEKSVDGQESERRHVFKLSSIRRNCPYQHLK